MSGSPQPLSSVIGTLIGALMTVIVGLTILGQMTDLTRETAGTIEEASPLPDPTPILWVVPAVVGLSLGVRLVVALGTHYSARRVAAPTVVGRMHRVETRDLEASTTCVCCEQSIDAGEAHEWANEFLVAGYPVRRSEGGVNHYCETCAEPMHVCHDGTPEPTPAITVEDIEMDVDTNDAETTA